MSLHVELVEHAPPEIRAIILAGLLDFNGTVLAPGMRIQDLAVALRDRETGTVVGGLWGRTGLDWLTIELLFVPEAARGHGHAASLIAAAEAEAARRGCHSAWLDTLNPAALALYERLGYQRFGELRDFPPGGRRVFLQKTLDAPHAP